MSGPRKPARPTGPRGKVRVAGSTPATGNPQNDPTEAAAEDTVNLAKPASKSVSKPASKSASDATPGETDGASAVPDRGSRTQSGPLTWRKVAIVAAVALVVGAFAAIAAFKPGVSATESNLAFTSGSDTSALTAQAGDRICAVLSVDPTNFDGWANTAKTGLTGEALTQFNDYQTTTKDLAAQSGQGAECKVDMVAVSHMDDSNASVIATLIISTTQQGVAVMTGPGQARTELGLQKVDGQWLISRISDF